MAVSGLPDLREKRPSKDKDPGIYCHVWGSRRARWWGGRVSSHPAPAKPDLLQSKHVMTDSNNYSQRKDHESLERRAAISLVLAQPRRGGRGLCLVYVSQDNVPES